MGELLTKAYVLIVAVVSLVGLVFVYVQPPQSMLKTRDGIAHFTPEVVHPDTGKPISLNELARHYRGD